MMDSLKNLLHHGWVEFQQAAKDSRHTQEVYLQRLLRWAHETSYGKKQAFSKINTPEAFKDAIPIQDAAEYEEALNHVFQGKHTHLLGSEILGFESTSGTTQGKRWIPYTAESLQDFRNAIFPWLYSLFYSEIPGLQKKKMYFAMSPALAQAHGNLPDHFFLGKDLAMLLAPQILMLNRTYTPDEVTQWKRDTQDLLLHSRELGFISIWSPQFLLNLLEDFSEEFIKEKMSSLRCISCWGDGSASIGFEKLKKLFPEVQFQNKGLMATEGFFSLPIDFENPPVLSIRSGFYEFLDSKDRSIPFDELNLGDEYDIVVSNFSGLFRYKIGDRVQVLGNYFDVPRFRFVGRSGLTSDLVGEKLQEVFVSKSLELSEAKRVWTPLAPSVIPHPHYQLFYDPEEISIELAASRRGHLERGLETNPHYQYARQLGQLRPIELRPIPGLKTKYQDMMLKRGANLSTLKFPSLLSVRLAGDF